VDTIATFVTDNFNTTVAKKTFMNRGCFGDDLAVWLGQELVADGYTVTAAPSSEDFGWAVKFIVEGRLYFASIGYVPGKVWFIALERGGVLARFLSTFRRIPHAAVEAVNLVLVRNADIRELKWHSPRSFGEALRPSRNG